MLRALHKETSMADPLAARIQANPKYLELRRKRNRIGWLLTASMMAVYYGYIALIAFDKELLARPIGAGVTTLGIPLGIGVIVFTIVITGFYVRRANSEFDRLTAEILKEATR
jgi:uncharacterized membrane protein (DUF485 family)